MSNHLIAQHLLTYARTLTGSAHLYRARAYRHAAMVVDGLPRTVVEILKTEGRPGLAKIPGIGDHLAVAIEALVKSGHFKPYAETRRHFRAVA